MYKTVAAIFATTVYFTKDCKPLLLYSYLLFFNWIFSGQRLSAKKRTYFAIFRRNLVFYSAKQNFDRFYSAHRNFNRFFYPLTEILVFLIRSQKFWRRRCVQMAATGEATASECTKSYMSKSSRTRSGQMYAYTPPKGT